MNPYLLLGFGAAWVTSIAATGWFAYGAGQDSEIATQAREQKVAQVATDAAARAAAQAISKIEVKHVTLRQELEREIHTNTVFRDCRSGDPAVRMLNDSPAIARPEPSGDRKLSTAAPAGG